VNDRFPFDFSWENLSPNPISICADWDLDFPLVITENTNDTAELSVFDWSFWIQERFSTKRHQLSKSSIHELSFKDNRKIPTEKKRIMSIPAFSKG
jgi:hypothetical protein